MGVTVAVIAIVLTLAVLVYFVVNRQHPEAAAGNDASDPSSSTMRFGNADDRPGDPGAEADGVAGRGQPAPGPSATSLDND